MGRTELYPGCKGQTQAGSREHTPSWKMGPRLSTPKGHMEQDHLRPYKAIFLQLAAEVCYCLAETAAQ